MSKSCAELTQRKSATGFRYSNKRLG
jgi:hypothetical protein